MTAHNPASVTSWAVIDRPYRKPPVPIHLLQATSVPGLTLQGFKPIHRSRVSPLYSTPEFNACRLTAVDVAISAACTAVRAVMAVALLYLLALTSASCSRFFASA